MTDSVYLSLYRLCSLSWGGLAWCAFYEHSCERAMHLWTGVWPVPWRLNALSGKPWEAGVWILVLCGNSDAQEKSGVHEGLIGWTWLAVRCWVGGWGCRRPQQVGPSALLEK